MRVRMARSTRGERGTGLGELIAVARTALKPRMPSFERKTGRGVVELLPIDGVPSLRRMARATARREATRVRILVARTALAEREATKAQRSPIGDTSLSGPLMTLVACDLRVSPCQRVLRRGVIETHGLLPRSDIVTALATSAE